MNGRDPLTEPDPPDKSLKPPWIPTLILVCVVVVGWILEWYLESLGMV